MKQIKMTKSEVLLIVDEEFSALNSEIFKSDKEKKERLTCEFYEKPGIKKILNDIFISLGIERDDYEAQVLFRSQLNAYIDREGGVKLNIKDKKALEKKALIYNINAPTLADMRAYVIEELKNLTKIKK